MEKRATIAAVVGAGGEILAALDKVPWHNPYLTLVVAFAFGVLLLIVLCRATRNSASVIRVLSSLAAIVVVLSLLGFAALFTGFLVCDPADPSGKLIGESATRKISTASLDQTKVQEEMTVPFTMNADAADIVFSAPTAGSRIAYLNAEPILAGSPAPINLETPSPKDDGAQYFSVKKGLRGRAKLTLTLHDHTSSEPIHLLAEVKYFHRSKFWYVFRKLYIYYG